MKRIYETVEDEVVEKKESLKDKKTWNQIIVKGVDTFKKEEKEGGKK